MTHSLRERRKRQLRDEILDAARTLLDQNGMAAVVMDELATLAGVSKPTLYNHFPSGKDEVIAALIAREIHRILAITDPKDCVGTPLQELGRILEMIVQKQINDQRQPTRIWFPEMNRLIYDHPEMMDAFSKLEDRMSTLIQAALDMGEIDPRFDTPTIMRAFYALVTCLHFQPSSMIGIPNPQSTPQNLARLFCRGVQSAVGTAKG